MYGFIVLGMETLLNKLKVPKRNIKIILIIILCFFMFLTGFTASCVRACAMVIMANLARTYL